MNNFLHSREKYFSFIEKLIMKAKIALILVIISTTAVMAGKTYSQTAKVSIEAGDKSIEFLMDEIEEQSEFYFIFNQKQIDVDRVVNISANNESIENVLPRMFADTDVKYVVLDRKILLTKEKESFISLAQQMIVTGTVVDENGESLPGVNVTVFGTLIGTITDFDGKYSITVPNNEAILIFSFIGYNTQEVISGGKTEINVIMTEDSQMLDEVVVIGYGSQRKKDLTGSVTGVATEQLLKGAQTSPMGMVQGKVAGLNVIKPNAGDPNSSFVYQIRGTSSLTGNTTPLIVVDGIPQGDLNAIPQDDIESIDILKDGSAAAIYGTRGTNGVILVTTKRGQTGTTNVSYNGYISTSTVLNTLDVMSAKQFKENGGADYGAETNWLDEVTRVPFSHSHNLSISGGTSNFNYRSSVAYKDQQGIQLNNGYQEIIARFVASQSFLNNKVRAEYDVTYRRQDRQNASNGVFRQAMSANPTYPVYDEAFAEWGGFWRPEVTGSSNPLASLLQRTSVTENGYLQGSARLTYNIISGLSISTFGTLYYNDSFSGNYTPRNIYMTTTFGSANVNSSNNLRQTIETTISYNKSIGRSNLAILGGHSYEKSKYQGISASNSNFDSDVFSYFNLSAGQDLVNHPVADRVGSGTTRSALASFFGRINYTYANKYLASISARREGSSRLGSNNKWGTFPAASLGWVISEENFMYSVPTINFLKLRVGYGVTGNMPSDDYVALAMMGVTGRVYDHTSQSWVNAYGPTQNVNEDIKWEKKGEWNIGLDITALNNRMSFTADLYKRNVTDLLYRYDVPTPPFQYESILANVGTSTAKGLELTLGGSPVKTNKVTWNANFNISFNNNIIEKFSNEIYEMTYIEMGELSSGDIGGLNSTPLIRLVEGGRAGNFYLPVYEGLTDDGKWIFKDVDRDGVFNWDMDREYVGNAQPKFIAGFSSDVQYGNFNLSFSLRSVVGNDVYNVSNMALGNLAVQGTDNNALVSVMTSNLNDAAVASSYYLEDGSFVKMDNLTFSYDVPFNTNYIRDLRLYLTAQNLFTLTNYTGVDPEVNMVDISNMGIERTSFYPSVRTFTLGVTVNF